MCLENVSKHYAVNNMKKTELTGYVYDFFIDYNTIDISDITNIHKSLIKKRDME